MVRLLPGPPIPWSGGSGTRESRTASAAARPSPPAAGSTPAVFFRPLALGLALPIVASLSGGDGAGQAGHGRPMASSRLPLVLALALKIRAAVSGSRDSGSNSPDYPPPPAVASPPHPPSAAQP